MAQFGFLALSGALAAFSRSHGRGRHGAFPSQLVLVAFERRAPVWFPGCGCAGEYNRLRLWRRRPDSAEFRFLILHIWVYVWLFLFCVRLFIAVCGRLVRAGCSLGLTFYCFGASWAIVCRDDCLN